MFRVVSCLMSSSMMVTSFSTTSEVRRNLSEIKDSNMLLILQLNIFTLLARRMVGFYFSSMSDSSSAGLACDVEVGDMLYE